MPESVLQWGINLILALQSVGEWPVSFLNFFTFLGNLEFYFLLLPALYWCVNGRLGLRVSIVLMLSIALNSILKLAIHDPRPYWLDPQVQLLAGAEGSFGIPSGHAQNAVVLWGLLAAYFGTGWGWGVAALVSAVIGFSRIFLGVHFPTDVLVGWLLGGLILFTALRWEAPLITGLSRQKKSMQVGFALLVSGGLALVGLLTLWGVSGSFNVPQVWQQNAAAAAPSHPIDPLSPKDLWLSCTVLGIVSLCIILFGVTRNFKADGTWGDRLKRFGLGLLVVIGIGFGSEALLATGGELLKMTQITVALLWVIVAAPLLFIKLGWANDLDIAGQ